MRITRCRWHDDPQGRCVEITAEDAPPGSMMSAKIACVSTDGQAWLRSRAPKHADDSGHFMRVAEVRQDRAELYVPWGMLDTRSDSRARYILVVVGAEASGSEETSARDMFHFEVQTGATCSHVDVLRPLIGLGVAVAYADGELTRSEVRCLKEVFTANFGLPSSEKTALKALLRQCPPDDLEPLARAALYRGNVSSVEVLLQFMEKIAAADGRITNDEIDVIDGVARALHADPRIVSALRERASEALDDPWEVLQIPASSSAQEVKSAYRKLIGDYHPDKWAQAPDRMRELAHHHSKRLIMAYTMITKGDASREEPGRSRPTVRTDFSAFGVRERRRWARGKRYQPEPDPVVPPAAPVVDPLVGRWVDHNMCSIVFTAQSNGYYFEEYGALGKVSEGRASRTGADVHLNVQSVLLGQYQLSLRINGPMLCGTFLVMGIPMPVRYFRT